MSALLKIARSLLYCHNFLGRKYGMPFSKSDYLVIIFFFLSLMEGYVARSAIRNWRFTVTFCLCLSCRVPPDAMICLYRLKCCNNLMVMMRLYIFDLIISQRSRCEIRKIISLGNRKLTQIAVYRILMRSNHFICLHSTFKNTIFTRIWTSHLFINLFILFRFLWVW